MRHLVPCLAALSIGCATSRPTEVRDTARPAADPVVSAPTTTTAVEAAAAFALETYVDHSTLAHGIVCVELEGKDDPGKVLDRLAPLASYLSVDRNECLGREPAAILSVGTPQLAGDRARVDVGVVLGSAGMLELERREGAWTVIRVTRPWISLR